MVMTVSSFGQKSITMNDAVNIALQRNSVLQKSLNSIKSYEAGVKSSYGNLLPSIGASGSWSWTRAEDEGGTLSFGSFVLPYPATVSQTRNFSASVRSDLNLFDGLASYARISQSKNNLESAKYQLERLKQDIVFQTSSFYYDIINGKLLLNVKEQDLKWNEKTLELIVERNKLGAITLADVYAQQVRVGNAELELLRARNNLQTLKNNFHFYLGLDITEEYTFEDVSVERDFDSYENMILEAETKEMSELFNIAIENRFDLKSALLNLETMKNDITIAQSGYFPTLSNSISYNLRANQFENLLDSRSLTVGLNLRFPIFNGWSTEARVQEAKVRVRNQEIDLNDFEREIKNNIKKSWLDLESAAKRFDVSKKNVKAAEQNRLLEEEKYNLGAGTLLNIMIANSDYVNARTNFINALFEYSKLKNQLDTTSVYLSIKSLNEFNEGDKLKWLKLNPKRK